jgi:hypothetical protein
MQYAAMKKPTRLCCVSTSIWKDKWFFHMKPEEKLFYLYLLTNKHTNFLGIYRLSIRIMSRETRLEKNIIEKTLTMFAADRKVLYIAGIIFILKWSIPG